MLAMAIPGAIAGGIARTIAGTIPGAIAGGIARTVPGTIAGTIPGTIAGGVNNIIGLVSGTNIPVGPSSARIDWFNTVSIELVVLVVVTVGSPLLIGVMRKIRSKLEGRAGAPIYQPLIDIRKLLHKQRTAPLESSWVFTTTPAILLGSTCLIAIVIPLVSIHPFMGQETDFFAVIFILLIGSIFLALAALDSGTAFGGMGASRSLTLSALGEPVLLVTVLALSIQAHTSNIGVLVQNEITHPDAMLSAQHLLALGAFLIVILAESGRLPVDNPNTHLELTMIHEAMILEYSGIDLGIVNLSEDMRFVLLLGLFVNLFVPWGIAANTGIFQTLLAFLALAVKITFLGSAVAVFEVFTAKLRLFRVSEFLAGGFVLAVLAVVTGVIVR